MANTGIETSLTLDSLVEDYHALPWNQRADFVTRLVDQALRSTEKAFSNVGDAAANLETVLSFVKKVEETDGIQLDQSKLEKIETARLRCTSHRVSVKQHTLRGILGDIEYEECFSHITSLTANEALQQYMRHGSQNVCDRRQLYVWLNEAVGNRLSTRKVGSRKTPSVTLCDIKRARVSFDKDLVATKPFLSLSPQDAMGAKKALPRRAATRVHKLRTLFKHHGMRLNRFGLYHDGGTSSVTPENDKTLSDTAISFESNIMTQNGESDDEQLSDGDSGISVPDIIEKTRIEVQANAEFNAIEKGHITQHAIDPNVDDHMSPDSLDSESSLGPAAVDLRSRVQNQNRDNISCKCSEVVPRLLMEWADSAAGLTSPVGLGLNLQDCTLTADTVTALALYADTPVLIAFTEHPVCHTTRRRMLKMLGLATHITSLEADKRIRSLWDGRADLKDWRQKHDSWLTMYAELKDNTDYINLFRFPAAPLPKPVLKKTRMLQQLFGLEWRRVVNDMAVDGNVVYTLGFDWLLEAKSNLIALMREEMDVMNYHSKREARNGKSFKGWSNASHHLLSAQLTRQDLWFWAATAALREDETYELTGIPAPAKYAVAGDNTGFRHIDYNFKQLLDEDKVSRGKTGHYRVQTALSLDDEDVDNCTIVIDGLHRNDCEDLWKLYGAAREFGQGPVVSLISLSDTEIRTLIGRTYRPIPVKAGGVRFMNATTFHGSTNTATKTRRVLFPWYARVDTDFDGFGHISRSFESDALGSVEDYIQHVTTLTTPPKTGGGRDPVKSRLPFRFAPQSFLLPSCIISSAISGIVPWDQPAVRAEVREFFRNPYVAIRRQRREMVRAFRWQMYVFRQAEREAFGENSFYVRHPERMALPEVKDDWVDAMDLMHASHVCLKDFAAGAGPYRECLGDGCVAEV